MAILWPWFDMYFWVAFLLVNIVFAIIVIYYERKHPYITLAWLAILLLAPVLGFVAYLFFGRTLSREQMFQKKAMNDNEIQKKVNDQLKLVHELTIDPEDKELARYLDMVRMLLINGNALVTKNNRVRLFSDGREKFDALLEDIMGAKHHINIEYYIFRDDELGKGVVSALAAKAKEGVMVRVLKDGAGCKSLPKDFFKEITDAGGQVVGFFEQWLRVYFRLNFRNHRKIAVIDGKIGYVGGFNIGDEYLGKGPLGDWRDSAIRVEGDAVHMLHLRFFLDWNYETGENIDFDEAYYPKIEPIDGVKMQIVSSGPDSTEEKIKYSFLKMVHSARESVWIQTPYFVPDDAILDALRIAALSGVDVRIMFPCKPDHMGIYWASYSMIGQLLGSGVKAFTYDNGFIHAKTIVVDGMVSSVGSANWDNRSFRLNFETNGILYDKEFATNASKLLAEN
ncbi:MAG: cardiolipin synthase [Candidatus Thermoplasmatota archaeon]|nr:cardiolipin synthase [Candidatus Thermoplasmatota archaeon]